MISVPFILCGLALTMASHFLHLALFAYHAYSPTKSNWLHMGSLVLSPFCVFSKICTAVGVHCSQAKRCMIQASAEGSFTKKETTLHKNVAQKKNRYHGFSQESPSSQNVGFVEATPERDILPWRLLLVLWGSQSSWGGTYKIKFQAVFIFIFRILDRLFLCLRSSIEMFSDLRI